MRVLVVGANGLLGSNVVAKAQERGWTVSGTYHSTEPAFDIPLTQFDLENSESFDEMLDEHDPDVVINGAAMTDVDACESNPERAQILNAVAPGELAGQCSARDVAFVHVSTDYVFDGETATPYTETDEPNPVQEYGASKLAGERAVVKHARDAVVPRLSFVWGIHRSTTELTGFPAWVRSKLESGESVPLFTDQWVTPTRAGQAAARILDLVEMDATGRYHIASKSCVTPYEFGEAIVKREEVGESLLEAGSVDDVDRPAPRPRYSCLDVAKLEAELERDQPTLREDVEAAWTDLDQI